MFLENISFLNSQAECRDNQYLKRKPWYSYSQCVLYAVGMFSICIADIHFRIRLFGEGQEIRRVLWAKHKYPPLLWQKSFLSELLNIAIIPSPQGTHIRFLNNLSPTAISTCSGNLQLLILPLLPILSLFYYIENMATLCQWRLNVVYHWERHVLYQYSTSSTYTLGYRPAPLSRVPSIDRFGKSHMCHG